MNIPFPIEADIRKFLAEWMKKHNYSYPVYLEHEPDMPAQCYVVEKTGSDEVNFIKDATVAIQSYGSTMEEAASLNELLKIAVADMVQCDRICNCRLSTDYPFTDTDTQEYRYQAVFNIRHY